MKKMRLKIFCASLFISSAIPSCGQTDDAPIVDSVMGIIDSNFYKKYEYIRYSYNRFFFPTESPTFNSFMMKFDSVVNYGKKTLNIYHIGGSHIQADIYTNEIRKYIQDFGPGLKTARGWIFPFSMIGTNNPGYYIVNYTGDWHGDFCTKIREKSDIGLLGAAAYTRDSVSSIKIYYRKEEQRYLHNKIRVYHHKGNTGYNVTVHPAAKMKSCVTDTLTGITEIILHKYTDTMSVRIVRSGKDTGEFRLYGFELLGDQEGVTYNTIGVNGASFASYARCALFEEQLKQTPPDMFIISIGTNDANTTDFSPQIFEKNYVDMIEKVRKANPNCAILLTVTNDCYYYRRYPNRNTALMRDVAMKLADRYGYGVWDFYTVMGGFGSSQKWYKDGLMLRDRIHFSYQGYLIKGALFYEAFLKYLEEFQFEHLVKQGKDKQD